jgi:hypothetical protein
MLIRAEVRSRPLELDARTTAAARSRDDSAWPRLSGVHRVPDNAARADVQAG